MTGAETAAAIGVPMFIFVITAIYGGIRLMLKGSSYMTRSATAQEASARAAIELADTLKTYMTFNDARVNDHDRQLFVLNDWRRGVDDWRRQSEQDKRNSP